VLVYMVVLSFIIKCSDLAARVESGCVVDRVDFLVKFPKFSLVRN